MGCTHPRPHGPKCSPQNIPQSEGSSPPEACKVVRRSEGRVFEAPEPRRTRSIGKRPLVGVIGALPAVGVTRAEDVAEFIGRALVNWGFKLRGLLSCCGPVARAGTSDS